MKQRDHDLGMHRRITRRDLLQGAGAVAAASFVPGQAFADQMLAHEKAGKSLIYPPALTGLRGSHAGSFDVAHQLVREGRRDWGPVIEPDAGLYDLVVVGAGISGLAAAHFYRQSNPNARILILDNHDDFGGHATRNEFTMGDHTLLGYGGSQTLEAPSGFNDATKALLRDLSIDTKRFDTAYDQNFYKLNGLGGGIYFDKENWGVDRVVRCEMGKLLAYLPLAPSGLSAAEAVAEMPMSESAREQILHVLTDDKDRLQDIPADEKEDYLYTLSYREFLIRHLGVTEQDVFAILQYLTADSGVGIESTTAGEALFYSGLPGRKSTGIPEYQEEAYIHHFPDGNASVARLLVRKLIPAVASGSTMEDVVTAKFDYSKLDLAAASVRLRLNSTVTNVEHDGAADKAEKVLLTYVRNGQACRVQAKHAVLACYNALIPAICPELPEKQREALAMQVKSPILYTSVAVNNWRAWDSLGVGAVFAPSSYHVNAMLDFPVSMGDYDFASDPDNPVVIHMERFFHRPNEDLEVRDQWRLGRHELFATSFETIERSIRNQLTGMLGESDFDPARDISGITVNRWAHGYSDSFENLKDPWYGDKNNERYPHVIGRKPYGCIAIANSDSGANAMLETAVEQAHRAVTELS